MGRDGKGRRMELGRAVAERRSVRGVLDTPVEKGLPRDLAVRAGRAATGGNL